ncbi:enoyl-CoA hydratase/isomerase family protein [Rhodococcus sp. NPDC057014]|uniref:enoyl-CoA hydratase/isomerase family protein n=1 Tax=Rhodococcus sp. NPDC057014 TaxID=3346000 RepID=UPI00362570D8
MKDYRAIEVTQSGQVATIRLRSLTELFKLDPPADPHMDIPLALEELRSDNSVRVIVITGEADGEFLVPPSLEYYKSGRATSRLANPNGAWNVGTGIVRTHQMMTEIEKPIIAKVNGDAIGFGQSILFSADFVIARDDAVVADGHLSMGDVVASDGTRTGTPFGVAPGDGAGALIPLFMTPPLAKEYMMLSRSLSTKELAEARIINRAVPIADLDEVTNDFVDGLLRRSAFALAWTKRLLNRHVATQLNQTLDAGVAYEFLNLAQIAHTGLDGDPSTLG